MLELSASFWITNQTARLYLLGFVQRRSVDSPLLENRYERGRHQNQAQYGHGHSRQGRKAVSRLRNADVAGER